MRGITRFAFAHPIVLILLLVRLMTPAIAAAQQTINFATVSGRVTDPSDAVLSGAQVSARETETNLTSTANTDFEGRFRFLYLKPGPYEITVHAAGFGDTTRSVMLTLGSAFELAISLRVASIET